MQCDFSYIISKKLKLLDYFVRALFIIQNITLILRDIFLSAEKLRISQVMINKKKIIFKK